MVPGIVLMVTPATLLEMLLFVPFVLFVLLVLLYVTVRLVCRAVLQERERARRRAEP